MLIMAINAGSSSLKWQIYQMPQEQQIAHGQIERLGSQNAVFTAQYGQGQTFEKQEAITTQELAVTLILTRLKSLGIIDRLEDIQGIGHRIVSGGELFKKSTTISPYTTQKIEHLGELAPLHNPTEAYYIQVFAKLLPQAKQVAVFDTSFYATMPAVNYLYPIDLKYYQRDHVRKYGAHGTSHRYIMKRTAQLLHKPVEQVNLITLHIGSGASITAIEQGQALDTSMGFTPLAGLMMGTRSGNLDPSILPYLMEKEGIFKIADLMKILNHKSGLLGVSGVSNDKRDLDEAAAAGNKRAQLAQDMFVNRIVKYVGSYLALLKEQPDALVFTAGIGENDPDLRWAVGQQLAHLGVHIDPVKNQVRGQEARISTPDSKIAVWVVPTNEELMIVRDTYELIDNKKTAL
ncbi:acetate kinase [Bombilactobacillus folatiphilus]|uniref:Acetate kinase n=1 Tax=Bombilactobacillus folatiphilus TaxID=2923362 RepID=A0ABY4P8U1_9LACO|nr:acetate kinase [Bombilactobacillus folatiphilus]UQS82138.1 acetate kinase [Bombilactobacillus folatiphilus]